MQLFNRSLDSLSVRPFNVLRSSSDLGEPNSLVRSSGRFLDVRRSFNPLLSQPSESVFFNARKLSFSFAARLPSFFQSVAFLPYLSVHHQCFMPVRPFPVTCHFPLYPNGWRSSGHSCDVKLTCKLEVILDDVRATMMSSCYGNKPT